MRFTCDTDTLLNVCINIERCVPAKGPLPHIECIYIRSEGKNNIRLCGFDLELGIISDLQVDLEEEGSVVLNAKTFLNMLKQIPGDRVYIESDDANHVTIRCDEVEYTMMSLDPDEYPEMPSVTEGVEFRLNQGDISNMVRQTIFAVSLDETKAAHRGLKFEITAGELKIVSLDGYRMAIRKGFLEYNGDPISFVSPTKVMNELMKLATNDDEFLVLKKGKRHIMLKIGGYTLISKLLEGEFLDYNRAMPKNPTAVVRVNTKEMIECIDRTSIIITDKSKSPLRLKIDSTLISMSTVTTLGSASASLPCSLDGNEIEIGFNNRFLAEALRSCETEEVLINLCGSSSPITIVPTDSDNFIYLVLPVRLV